MISMSHETLTPAARRLLLERVRAEFAEMPGLVLTIPEAVRLLGLPADVAASLLSELCSNGFLQPPREGRYRRNGAASAHEHETLVPL